MPLDNKQKRIIAGVCTAGAVIGGVAIYMASKRKVKDDHPEGEEDAFGVPPQTADLKGNTQSSKNITNNNNMDQSNTTTFNEFFCTVHPSHGWEVFPTPAPVPTMALISFKNPSLFDYESEAANSIPGEIPGVMLTIEDISSECLTEKEMHEKNRTMALQQMEMMTQGRARAVVERDAVVSDMGVFKHYLEYTQTMMPYINMRICNITAVRNGLAYVFQYMASPTVFAEHKAAVFDMARGIVIHEDTSPSSTDYTLGAYIHVTIPTHHISTSTQTSWMVKTGAGGLGPLAEITTGSMTKKEMFAIYRDSESAKAALSSGGFEVDDDNNANANIIKYKNKSNGKESKLFTSKSSYFALVATPLKIKTIVTDDCHLMTTLHSVTDESDSNMANKTISRVFINKDDKYEFPLTKDGCIIKGKIGCGTSIYAPSGLEAMQAGTEAPTVTLRVGTPETDPSCVATLDEWKEKLVEENAIITAASISDISMGGEPGITFTTKEMEDVGEGRKSEVQSKVVIVVRNGSTSLLRWESPSGVWRVHERHMTEMIREFKFL